MLKALYVGRPAKFYKDRRTGKSGTLFYDTLARCDKLRFYHLCPPTPEMSRDEASVITAILEGVFCQLFGSYMRKEDYIENRRTYSLDNMGDDVIGCNGELAAQETQYQSSCLPLCSLSPPATPCIEPPTALTTGQAILNPDYVSAVTRVWFAHRHLRETMAKTWDEDEVKGARDALRAAHDDWLVVFQRLIKEGKLRFLNSRLEWRGRILIRQWLGCQLPQDLVHALCSYDWLLKLEMGSSSSVNALTEEDKGVFEGIAITVKGLDREVEAVWRFSKYHLIGAPRKLMTYMLEALSEEQQRRRCRQGQDRKVPWDPQLQRPHGAIPKGRPWRALHQ